MKTSFVLIITVLSNMAVLSQKWEHTIGQPNNYEASRRLIEHYDNGYLMAAQFDDLGWLVKTDINGDVLWDIILGNDPEQVIIEKTLFDELGNMYLFGTLHQNIEPFWPLVIKLNACGELEWCHQLYFEEYDDGAFYDAIILKNGDLLALANMPNEDQHDMIYLFRITSDGEYIWKKSYASRNNYPLFEMRLGSRIQFFNDIYIISGYVYSPHPNFPTVSSIRPMFIGIDTMFNEQWVVEFGLDDNMKGKALTSIPINDSLFMGVGRYRHADSAGMTKDAWAMFYNHNGEQTGYTVISRDKLAPEINESTFFEVEQLNDNIFIATSGYFYGEENEGAMGEIVFDTAGNVYNYTIRDGTAGGNSSVIKTFDGKYVISCSYRYPNFSYDAYLYKVNDSLEQDSIYPDKYTYDNLCNNLPIQSGIINLTSCDIITNIKEIPSLEDYYTHRNMVGITAYPNPANGDEISFEFTNTCFYRNMELKCFNIYSQEVLKEKIHNCQGRSVVNIGNWQKRMYIAAVFSEGIHTEQCKFVIK